MVLLCYEGMFYRAKEREREIEREEKIKEYIYI